MAFIFRIVGVESVLGRKSAKGASSERISHLWKLVVHQVPVSTPSRRSKRTGEFGSGREPNGKSSIWHRMRTRCRRLPKHIKADIRLSGSRIRYLRLSVQQTVIGVTKWTMISKYGLHPSISQSIATLLPQVPGIGEAMSVGSKFYRTRDLILDCSFCRLIYAIDDYIIVWKILIPWKKINTCCEGIELCIIQTADIILQPLAKSQCPKV